MTREVEAVRRLLPAAGCVLFTCCLFSAVDAQPHPTTQCSTIEPGDGEEVVACGFPEDVSLVGATAEHLAIASRSRPSSSERSLMIHRLDRSNAALEQLVDSKATSSGTPLPVGFSGAAAGVVVFEKGRFVVAYRRANTSMGVVASRVLP